MSEIVVHEGADEELRAATIFYDSRESGLGAQFLDEFSLALEKILKRPLSHSVFFDQYRRYLMFRFPYSVVYRTEGERIVILAVAHLRRRPGYWSDRS